MECRGGASSPPRFVPPVRFARHEPSMIDVSHKLRYLAWVALAVFAWPTTHSLADEPAPAKVDFVRDIQPLFEKHCYECHGPKKQEAGLRLDRRAAALAGGDVGHDIVPGKSDESLLAVAIAGATEEVSRMPAKREPLSPAEIASIKSWIDQGAAWPDSAQPTSKDSREHWAFRAPVRPVVPAVKDSTWARNDVDRFILARLEAEGLAPSAPADKVTLLRRLSLDLIGLPPTIAEVDAFLADDSAERLREAGRAAAGLAALRRALGPALARRGPLRRLRRLRKGQVAQRLVLSRLGRSTRSTATCRTTSSSSSSSPATCCPGATQDQIVATGFLRNSMINEEGGIDPEQFRMEAMFDRMDALGKSVLGLTIQCCQCHNHKFDPLTQEEYYRLFAFLNNDHEAAASRSTRPRSRCARATSAARSGEIEAGAAARDARLARADGRLGGRRSRDQPALGSAARREVDDDSGGGAKLSLLADGSMLCAGLRADQAHVHASSARPTLEASRPFRLELLDRSRTCRAAGRAGRSRGPAP